MVSPLDSSLLSAKQVPRTGPTCLPLRPEGPKTIFVDWAELEANLTARATCSIHGVKKAKASPHQARGITTVDSEVRKLRRNVRGTAKAVLQWAAAVVEHAGQTNLDDVLDRCLRPGPNVHSVNYHALAREIQRTMHVRLSAKRIKTAITHLRKSQNMREKPQQTMMRRFDALQDRLQANHAALVEPETAIRRSLCRSIGTDVLVAVRCAAGHLIENDYGEGIPREMDVETLEGQFLDFVRDIVRTKPMGERGAALASDLHRLLITLCDYDASCESDMRLVIDGSRVVADLLGPHSLCGLLARLNVLMAGRNLLDTPLYCTELLRLAEAADGLHEDPETQRFMNWVRRLPEEKRTPSPIRVASYCLNNVATHILERLYKDELPDSKDWLKKAKAYFDQMRQRDSSFRLVKTTQALYLTVVAKLTGQTAEAEAFFAKLGQDGALRILKDLIQFDNCEEMVLAARQHACAVWPKLRHQLIRLA